MTRSEDSFSEHVENSQGHGRISLNRGKIEIFGSELELTKTPELGGVIQGER